MSTGFGEPITPDPSQKQSRTPRTKREEQEKDEDEEEGGEEDGGDGVEEEQKDPLGGEDQLRVKGERGGSDEGEILSRL